MRSFIVLSAEKSVAVARRLLIAAIDLVVERVTKWGAVSRLIFRRRARMLSANA
jgi:hypothetical protein